MLEYFGREYKLHEKISIYFGTDCVRAKADLMNEAEKMTRRIASFGPLAMGAIKELAWRGTFEMGLLEGLRFERIYALINCNTQDAAEGPRAWLEKRTPRY